MAKTKDVKPTLEKKVKDGIWYAWSWVRWPYDLLMKVKLWIINTPVWKKMEAMEYDPPPYPLSWWFNRGIVIVLILMVTHWWSYEEGRKASPFASASISMTSSKKPDAEVNYFRNLAFERTNSMKRWKAIANRLDSDNTALNLRINEMRAMAGEKANMAAVAPKRKRVIRKKTYKKSAKAKVKPTQPTWLSGP